MRYRTFLMKCLLPLLVASSLCTSANAALLLTIDTSTKTVAWSGSFTSDTIITTSFDFPNFFLANTLTSNPNPSPLKVIATTNGTLSTSISGQATAGYNQSSPGQVNTTPSISLISVFLGGAFDFDPDSFSLNASVADGTPKSYADFDPTQTAFLESLDGVNLILVRTGDNSPTNTEIGIAGGGPAATISVIPEPSSLILGAIGSLALLRRRR